MYVIAGLGNPGLEYSRTRHNAGFMVIDILAEQFGINVSKLKHKALLGEGSIDGEKIVLVKPQTYMNESGRSILDIKNWYKVENKNIIIIYDDIDLDVGSIRVRKKGSAGTHNGMKSVIYQLNSENFPRIRVGVGNRPEYMRLADYVLSKFREEEQEPVFESLKAAADSVSILIKYGINEAMNKYNKKQK